MESLHSDISSLTESEAVYPPVVEGDAMADKEKFGSDDEGEVRGKPAAPSDVPTPLPQPGRLELPPEDGMNKGSILKAPRKPRLEKGIIPSSLAHSKSLFKNKEEEPMDSSILTDGAHMFKMSFGCKIRYTMHFMQSLDTCKV